MIRRFSRLFVGVAALAAIVWTLACAHVPQMPAQGAVAGYAISGPVDSRIAQDYIEERPLPEALERTRRRLLMDARTPTRDELTTIAQLYSPDVATLLFIETVAALPANRALRDTFDAELSAVSGQEQCAVLPDIPDDFLILLVPGWFYRANGAITNADYHIQRELFERCNVAHRLVPVDENGSVSANAVVVAAAIREATRTHRVFVVSASKSGAEVALALGRDLTAPELTRVEGWLSIGGVVQGSPLADRMLEPDLCWLTDLKLGIEGFNLEGLKSMQTRPSRRAFAALRFPSHIRIISYVPAPLSGDISERGAFGYHRMREQGPNDGLTLLADELIPGGTTILAPGIDHFLDSPDAQNAWSIAILRIVMRGKS